MTARQSSAADEAVRLLRAGHSTREAARLSGLSHKATWAAGKRAGVTGQGKPGKPKS